MNRLNKKAVRDIYIWVYRDEQCVKVKDDEVIAYSSKEWAYRGNKWVKVRDD